MKFCPQCKKENPGVAKYCIYCGTALYEENPDESLRLQTKLNDASEMITVLKQSLSMSQEQAKSEADTNQALLAKLSAEKQEYEKIIATRDKKCSDLEAQLTFVKNQQKKNDHTPDGLRESLPAEISEQQAEIDMQKTALWLSEKKLQKIEKELHVNEEKLWRSEEKYNGLSAKFDDLRKIFPLIITRIEFGNCNNEGNMIDYFGNALYSSNMRFLTIKIHFTNYLEKGKTFNFTINYYDSQGKLQYNISTGARPASKNYISPTDYSAILTGWGNTSGGAWNADTYTVEIWSDGVCLGSGKFTIN